MLNVYIYSFSFRSLSYLFIDIRQFFCVWSIFFSYQITKSIFSFRLNKFDQNLKKCYLSVEKTVICNFNFISQHLFDKNVIVKKQIKINVH